MDDRYKLRSLNSTLDILECFVHSGPELGVSDLSRLVGMSKGAVHRVLSNLVERGYVVRDDARGRYQLGLRLWELGTASIGQFELRDIASPCLRRLTDMTGETTHLAVYESGEVVYIDKVATTHAVQAYSRIGGRAPAYCVATGKALLAHQPLEERNAVASGLLKQHTSGTIVDGDHLLGELSRIATQGYAINAGEWRSDVIGAAAPIFDRHGTAVAAVGISGPYFRLTVERAHEEAPRVIEAAESISRLLGWEEQPE